MILYDQAGRSMRVLALHEGAVLRDGWYARGSALAAGVYLARAVGKSGAAETAALVLP